LQFKARPKYDKCVTIHIFYSFERGALKMRKVLEILFGANMEKGVNQKISTQLKHIISVEDLVYRQRNSILAGVNPKKAK
jgi:hypothetical protein